MKKTVLDSEIIAEINEVNETPLVERKFLQLDDLERSAFFYFLEGKPWTLYKVRLRAIIEKMGLEDSKGHIKLKKGKNSRYNVPALFSLSESEIKRRSKIEFEMIGEKESKVREKKAYKEAKKNKFSLPSTDKIRNVLNRLVSLNLIDSIRDETDKRSDSKYVINSQTWKEYKTAMANFHEKIANGLIKIEATTELERELYRYNDVLDKQLQEKINYSGAPRKG